MPFFYAFLTPFLTSYLQNILVNDGLFHHIAPENLVNQFLA